MLVTNSFPAADTTQAIVRAFTAESVQPDFMLARSQTNVVAGFTHRFAFCVLRNFRISAATSQLTERSIFAASATSAAYESSSIREFIFVLICGQL